MSLGNCTSSSSTNVNVLGRVAVGGTVWPKKQGWIHKSRTHTHMFKATAFKTSTFIPSYRLVSKALCNCKRLITILAKLDLGLYRGCHCIQHVSIFDAIPGSRWLSNVFISNGLFELIVLYNRKKCTSIIAIQGCLQLKIAIFRKFRESSNVGSTSYSGDTFVFHQSETPKKHRCKFSQGTFV